VIFLGELYVDSTGAGQTSRALGVLGVLCRVYVEFANSLMLCLPRASNAIKNASGT
jgi:hypothetical protein